MQQMVNGKMVEIPLDHDGAIDSDTLREVASIPKNRTLVQQLSTRENLIVNPGERIKINPSDYFRDIPDHVRGRRRPSNDRP